VTSGNVVNVLHYTDWISRSIADKPVNS